MDTYEITCYQIIALYTTIQNVLIIKLVDIKARPLSIEKYIRINCPILVDQDVLVSLKTYVLRGRFNDMCTETMSVVSRAVKGGGQLEA